MPLVLTRTESRKGVAGNLRYESLDVAYDTSYDNTGTRASSGETGLNPAALGMDVFHLVLAEQRAGYTFDFDYDNNRLHAFRSPAVAVATHGTHPHNITTVAAAGAGTAMLTPMVAGALEGGAQVNTAAVDASAAIAHTSVAEVALAEVANATNLATALAQVRVFVLGQ